MARTGLRMMPTFPSPSLKFRTVGFPQYGFKASLSDRAFLQRRAVKPAPGMPRRDPVCITLRTLPPRHRTPGTGSRLIRASACRCTRGTHLATPGVLGSGPSYVVSVHHRVVRPHPSVSQARDDFTACRLYATPSLCGSAEATRETFPLSLSCCPHVPSTLRRWVRATFPLWWCRGTRLPRSYSESPPTSTRLCQQSPTGLELSALHRSRHAAARMFALSSGLAPTSMPPYARHRAF